MNIDLDTIRRANVARQKEWDGDAQFSEIFFADALAGEVGEAAEIIQLLALQVMLNRASGQIANMAKKFERHRLGLRGSTTDKAALGKELADILTYTDLMANKLGLSLGEEFVNKFNDVSFKYGMKTHFEVAINDGGVYVARLVE